MQLHLYNLSPSFLPFYPTAFPSPLPDRADEDTEAGLLEDVDVVVVGVAHGPAAAVPLRLVEAAGEDVAAVAVRPLRPAVHAIRGLERYAK